MLRVEDPDGFVDRQLFDFPPDRDVYLEDLKVPIPNDVPNLKDVFKVVMQCLISCRHDHAVFLYR